MRLQNLLPFPVRIELARLRRMPSWWRERSSIARTRLEGDAQGEFEYLLARHASPLERAPGAVPAHLQRGKVQNITIAAKRLDGLLLRPKEVFSYHHSVGRPSWLRGFRMGLELRNGKPSGGIGGGCCQISNALYLLALQSGQEIVERHRHGLDLFPDHDRKVPFGCGATVFYNYADLRFTNPLASPLLLRLRIANQHLVGEMWTTADPGWTADIYEVDHRFFRQDEQWWRENRVRRRFLSAEGEVLRDEEIAHNLGRVLYEPTGAESCDATD
jgi:vancomycin resistance protein VanW